MSFSSHVNSDFAIEAARLFIYVELNNNTAKRVGKRFVQSRSACSPYDRMGDFSC